MSSNHTLAGRVNILQDTTATTQTNGNSVIAVTTTNASLVIAPNGTGALIADIPDGAGTGGGVRGENAVDLQLSRFGATQIASGIRSALLGGTVNTASNTNSAVVGGTYNSATNINSFVGGGQENTASGVGSVCVGGGIVSGNGNTASGDRSGIIAGARNIASATYSTVIGGDGGRSYLLSQTSRASGQFAATGDAQTSAITLRRSITGITAPTSQELFLDGASVQAILNIASPGPTNARLWNVRVDVAAIVATAGAGGLAVNDSFSGNYMCAVRRTSVAGSAALIGAGVITNQEVYDTNMSSCVVTIDTDTATGALRIQFTPPTLADVNTVIRVVATAYLTEVGR